MTSSLTECRQLMVTSPKGQESELQKSPGKVKRLDRVMSFGMSDLPSLCPSEPGIHKLNTKTDHLIRGSADG